MLVHLVNFLKIQHVLIIIKYLVSLIKTIIIIVSTVIWCSWVLGFMSWKFGLYKIQVCQLSIEIITHYVEDSLEYQLNNAYTQEEISRQFICTYSNPEYSGVMLIEGDKYKSADTVLWEF